MSKVVDINPTKRLNEEFIEGVVDLIRSVPPEKIKGLFLTMEVEADETMEDLPDNVDSLYFNASSDMSFSQIGYIDTILTAYKHEMLNSSVSAVDNPFDNDE